jgi:putative tryptophan/tyrosine transport system substrate-binding protein
MSGIKRRDFIALLGGAAVWPLVGRAQAALPVIGILSGATFESMNALLAWFYPGLESEGFIENRNFTTQFRWADDNYDRLPALASDLVRRRVDLIVALGTTPGAQAAKAATRTIPIVFLVGTDPVEVGLVPSLARPGGNLTGVTILVVELLAKNLSLMHELVPSASSIGVLINPANPSQAETELRDAQTAARTLGVGLLALNARTPGEIETAFETLVRQGAGGLVITGETFFLFQRAQIAELAARYKVPAISGHPDYINAGGLMSYGTSLADIYGGAGVSAGRILKGEKPADLPVQQATKVELAINLKAAKALGLTVPLSLLGRADEVIE